jgi:CoA:oxalate CoA-transferase
MGPVKMQGVVVKLSDTPGAVETSAPELGEHNTAIYAEIGLEEADLKVLAEENVI